MAYIPGTMLVLNDSGLRIVTAIAANLPVEKRQLYLERVAAALARVRRPGDADVESAARAAMRGLMQAPAA
jgi:hypothetical protein